MANLHTLTLADLHRASTLLESSLTPDHTAPPLFIAELLAMNRELLTRLQHRDNVIAEMCDQIDALDTETDARQLLTEGRY